MIPFVTTNTTAAKLFKSLNDYIPGKLNWVFCVGVVMDSPDAMTAQLFALYTCVKRLLLNVSLCNMIYRQRTARQKLSLDLNVLQEDVFKTISHIKVHALNLEHKTGFSGPSLFCCKFVL